MLELSQIHQKLQSALTPKRYTHTLGVVHEAVALAKQYGEDIKKAELAALLHDCAKDYPESLTRRLCKEYHIPLDDVMNQQIDLAHSFLGAEVAKREYGVEDLDIQNGICYHTTGRADMTLLEEIIFIADYIEMGRTPFPGLDEARECAYRDIHKAMPFILKHTVEHIRQQNKLLHPLSLEALAYYEMRREGEK